MKRIQRPGMVKNSIRYFETGVATLLRAGTSTNYCVWRGAYVTVGRAARGDVCVTGLGSVPISYLRLWPVGTPGADRCSSICVVKVRASSEERKKCSFEGEK